MSLKQSQIPHARSYTKGQPFMPAWLDDSDLNDAEMRVLLHLWRRGQTCYPSVKTIASKLKKSEATVARCIKTLEKKGYLIRQKRKGNKVRNSNLYVLLCPENPLKNHSNDSIKPVTGGGIKELKEKDLNLNEQRSLSNEVHLQEEAGADFNSTLASVADVEPEAGSIPREDSVILWAESFYRKHQYDSAQNVGILKPHEVKKIALEWLDRLIKNEGMIEGAALRKPRAALESYIVAYANNQSKRCNELHGRKSRKRTLHARF